MRSESNHAFFSINNESPFRCTLRSAIEGEEDERSWEERASERDSMKAGENGSDSSSRGTDILVEVVEERTEKRLELK